MIYKLDSKYLVKKIKFKLSGGVDESMFFTNECYIKAMSWPV